MDEDLDEDLDEDCSEEFEENHDEFEENDNYDLPDSLQLLQRKAGGAFPEESVQVLRFYHARGMTGTGRQHGKMVREAASRAGLNEEQVTRWIKKENFRRKRMVEDSDEHRPLKQAQHITKWNKFLKKFARSEEAKAALKDGGLKQYNEVASKRYRNISPSEQAELLEEPITEKRSHMTGREVRAAGRKAFHKIQKQFEELERLGFEGFAIGFYKECSDLAGTKRSINCVNAALLEYLHAVIVSANPPSIIASSSNQPTPPPPPPSSPSSAPVPSNSKKQKHSSHPNVPLKKTAASSAAPSLPPPLCPPSLSSVHSNSKKRSHSSPDAPPKKTTSAATPPLSSPPPLLSSALSNSKKRKLSSHSAILSKKTASAAASPPLPPPSPPPSPSLSSAPSNSKKRKLSSHSAVPSKKTASAAASPPLPPPSPPPSPSLSSAPSNSKKRNHSSHPDVPPKKTLSAASPPPPSPPSLSSALSNSKKQKLSSHSAVPPEKTASTATSPPPLPPPSPPSPPPSPHSPSMSSAPSNSKEQNHSSHSDVPTKKTASTATPSSFSSLPTRPSTSHQHSSKQVTCLNHKYAGSEVSSPSTPPLSTSQYSPKQETFPDHSTHFPNEEKTELPATSAKIITISSSPVKEDDPDVWLQTIPFLLNEDKERIESKQWLNCRIIDACQEMLQKHARLPLSGFQSPQMGKRYRFKKVTGNFVQILNVNSETHWIVVSNIGCKPSTVNVYDSAYSVVSKDTQKQICSFMQPEKDELVMQMPIFQRQPNAHDCGVFAIAVATELTMGLDPHHCYWDISRMRSHLVQSLQKGEILQFPLKSHRRIPLGNKFKKTLVVKIYCVCRSPNDTSREMIKCDSCGKWMHKDCMGLSADTDISYWCCGICK